MHLEHGFVLLLVAMDVVDQLEIIKKDIDEAIYERRSRRNHPKQCFSVPLKGRLLRDLVNMR